MWQQHHLAVKEGKCMKKNTSAAFNNQIFLHQVTSLRVNPSATCVSSTPTTTCSAWPSPPPSPGSTVRTPRTPRSAGARWARHWASPWAEAEAAPAAAAPVWPGRPRAASGWDRRRRRRANPHRPPTSGTSSPGKGRARRRWYDEGRWRGGRWSVRSEVKGHVTFTGTTFKKNQKSRVLLVMSQRGQTIPESLTWTFNSEVQIFWVGSWNFTTFSDTSGTHHACERNTMKKRKKSWKNWGRKTQKTVFIKRHFGFMLEKDFDKEDKKRLCWSGCSNNRCKYYNHDFTHEEHSACTTYIINRSCMDPLTPRYLPDSLWFSVVLV